ESQPAVAASSSASGSADGFPVTGSTPERAKIAWRISSCEEETTSLESDSASAGAGSDLLITCVGSGVAGETGAAGFGVLAGVAIAGKTLVSVSDGFSSTG